MNLVRNRVAAVAAAFLFTACGGGGTDTPPTSSASTSASLATSTSAQVQLEGCVVDQNDQPRATRVHAFSEDGRLVATATSSPQGVFQLKVPARQRVSVGLDAPGHESLLLLTGSSNVALGGCLRERTA
jgi:hypothetical protein